MPKNIVIIGSSTGGPKILPRLCSRLPKLKACVIIVQHMPKFINDSLRNSLNATTDMDVRLAEDGAFLEEKVVYVSPSERHMKLTGNRRIKLTDGEKVNFVCPSVDVMMKSIKKTPSTKVVGVILTGIGKDGAEGITHLKEIGGTIIAQSRSTCVVDSMPKSAIETGNVDFILSPEEIGDKITELVIT